MDETPRDYIVSELLSELKAENIRKDNLIAKLRREVLALSICALAAVLMVISGFLLYLNQYDFSSTETLHIEKTAEGTYAFVDSEGNTVGLDLTSEQIEEWLTDGNS